MSWLVKVQRFSFDSSRNNPLFRGNSEKRTYFISIYTKDEKTIYTIVLKGLCPRKKITKKVLGKLLKNPPIEKQLLNNKIYFHSLPEILRLGYGIQL